MQLMSDWALMARVSERCGGLQWDDRVTIVRAGGEVLQEGCGDGTSEAG